jgi:allantoinase
MPATTPFDRIIRGTLVLPDRILANGWIATRGDMIAGIGEGPSPVAVSVEDYGNHLIMPGLVDGHMHTSSSRGWPGIEGASKTAAAGGVTTCVDMPYDVPRPVTDAGIFKEKVEYVNRLSHVDIALYGTILKSGGVDAIAGLAEAGACSFKLSTYEYDPVRFPRIDHPTMVAAFRDRRSVKPWRIWRFSKSGLRPARMCISPIHLWRAVLKSRKCSAAWAARHRAKPACNICA